MSTGERFAEALKLFLERDPGFEFYAEHDIIYGPRLEVFTDEDFVKLEELGWHRDEDGTVGYFC